MQDRNGRTLVALLALALILVGAGAGSFHAHAAHDGGAADSCTACHLALSPADASRPITLADPPTLASPVHADRRVVAPARPRPSCPSRAPPSGA